MATIAYASAQAHQYYHQLAVSIVGQDVVANTTTLSYNYTVTNGGSYGNGAWTYIHEVTFHAVINGVDHTSTPNLDFRNAPKTVSVMSGTQVVSHGSDGLKSINISLSANGIVGSVNFTAVSSSTVAFPLTSIPRASSFTINPNPIMSGDSATIDISRFSGAFTHTVTWSSGASSGTVATGVGTSTTYTPDVALLTGVDRAPITVTVTTFSGATQIGSAVSRDIIFRSPPTYPEVGVGTPYDLRVRRTTLDGANWIVMEEVPFSTATVTDTLSASGTCTLSVPRDAYSTNLDDQVIVVDAYDGSQWLDLGMAFILTRSESDATDMTGTVTYTGVSFGDWLLSKALVSVAKDWTSSNAGAILGYYFDQAKGRGWGPYIEKTFSSTKTSINTNWQNSDVLNAAIDTPISQILSGFVSGVLAEYRTHFNVATGKVYLDMYNPGYGSDWTIKGSDPIINISTAGMFKIVDTAPVRKDSADKLTRVYVRGDDAATTREAASNVNPLFGHLEGTVAASGIKSDARLRELGDALLASNKSASIERTFSYDLSSTQTPTVLFPYRTFRPGDWIIAPGETGLERIRVAQVAITRSSEGTKATITAGDLIPNGITATARKQSQAGGGAIAGGTMQSPSGIKSTIPSAPIIIDVVSAGYWANTGAARSGINISWAPVNTGVSGSNLNIDLYEVWIRDAIGTPWTLGSFSDTTDLTLSNLDVNKSYDLQVRARSVDGIYGLYSDVYTVVTLAPLVDLDGPVIADLYTDGLGTISIVWEGIIGATTAPARLAYVVAEISTDGGTTYITTGTPIVGPGTIVLNMGGVWGEYFVRIRGYDRLGNAGDVSAVSTITLTDPHLVSPIPEAPTGLASTAGASWDVAGVLPLAWFDLTWTGPTLDVDGHAVTIVGYDVWGKPSTESELRFLTSSVTEAVRIPVRTGEDWSFQVNAASDAGGVSALSTSITDTADATIAAPTAPTAPTLSQYAGLLRVQWAGGGMVPEIKYAFASISTTLGGTYTRAGMPLTGAGEVVIPGLATGTTYYAKINLVDELGQTAASTASAGLLLDPITGVTIQTSAIANTGIKMNSSSLTAYDDAGNPTFILDAATGEVWIAPYDAVFNLGAPGTTAETGVAVTGVQVSSDNSSFNTFVHPSGLQIRNDQTPLSWWEADATDASLVNFFSPRAVIGQRLRIADYEAVKETKVTGTRLVFRYKGA